MASIISWICDIIPETPALLVEKTDSSPTMSLIAHSFDISLEENRLVVLDTLLTKASKAKILE